MNWFYSISGGQQGPVTEAQLDELLSSGIINPDTLVWREGMTSWQPMKTVRVCGPAAITAGKPLICSECGKVFSPDDLIQLNSAWVCGQCKPIVVQKMSEGVATSRVPGNMWRSKKQLVTVSETPFPDRCVKCNAPTDGYRLKRILYWHPPAYYLLLLCNILVLLVVVMIVRKKAVLNIGLCAAHRAQRKQTILISSVGALGGLAVAIIGGVALQSGWPVFIGVLALLGFGIYGGVKAPMVAATKITKDNVWLKGVGPEFLADLPEWPGA